MKALQAEFTGDILTKNLEVVVFMKEINLNSFTGLITSIKQLHEEFASQVNKAVNVSLTLRNWCIGAYIHEYELKGNDRAGYGKKALENLSQELRQRGLKRMDARELRRYRQLFNMYPHIRESLTPELNQSFKVLPENHICESVTPKFKSDEFISQLSFTHICEFLRIEDSHKREFYEREAIRGTWSVKELKRQINSLCYERSGLSNNKVKQMGLVQGNAKKENTLLNIRDPYIFEFLGFKAKEVMSESDLENQLLNKIEEFLLELGNGFCFESRQKRILIGDAHYFIDLVFYHRILKCHILVELKLAEFNHENIGQLNTYVSWYKKNMITEGDNPPVGILLCTSKNQALVEYALAGMDDNLFVSKYQLELPAREDIQRFIKEKIEEGEYD